MNGDPKGMTRTLIGTMIIGILAMFFHYSGVLEVPVEWLSMLNMNVIAAFTLAGVAGAAALLASYTRHSSD